MGSEGRLSDIGFLEAGYKSVSPIVDVKPVVNEGEEGDTVGLTRFYWILSSNPAILVEISTRITEFSERIQ